MVAERPKPIECGILHHGLGKDRHQLHQDGKRFEAGEPRSEVAALLPYTIQPDARGNSGTVPHLVVSGESPQARRRMGVRAVIDVFRAGDAVPGRRQAPLPTSPHSGCSRTNCDVSENNSASNSWG